MGGAALLALALVFTGCNNAYDVTTTDTIPSLSVKGLKAENSQKGVITLKWERDYDVLRYDVYRQTGDEPAVELSWTNQSNLFTDRFNRMTTLFPIPTPWKRVRSIPIRSLR
jgi:hypothetical protein